MKAQNATPAGRLGTRLVPRASSIRTTYKTNGLFSTSNRGLRIASNPERQPWFQPREYLANHGDQEGETTRNSDYPDTFRVCNLIFCRRSARKLN